VKPAQVRLRISLAAVQAEASAAHNNDNAAANNNAAAAAAAPPRRSSTRLRGAAAAAAAATAAPKPDDSNVSFEDNEIEVQRRKAHVFVAAFRAALASAIAAAQSTSALLSQFPSSSASASSSVSASASGGAVVGDLTLPCPTRHDKQLCVFFDDDDDDDENVGDETSTQQKQKGDLFWYAHITPLPPNHDKIQQNTKPPNVKRCKTEQKDVGAAAPVDLIDALDSSDDDDEEAAAEGAGSYATDCVDVRVKNPLLAVATYECVRAVAELAPNVHTLRMNGWPLCQRSLALLLKADTLPALRRLSLVGCAFYNAFTSLGGASHPCITDVNLSAATHGEHVDREDRYLAQNQLPVLVAALPSLQRLAVARAYVQIGSRFVAALAKHCGDLRSLTFSGDAEGENEEGVVVRASDMQALVAAAPRLEALSVECAFSVAAAAATHALFNAPAMRRLRVVGGGRGHDYDADDEDEEDEDQDADDDDDLMLVVEDASALSKGSALPSLLEYVEVNGAALLNADAFQRTVAPRLRASTHLKTLRLCTSTYYGNGDGNPSTLDADVAAVITDATTLCELETLDTPGGVLTHAAVLTSLAAGRLPALRSWTATPVTSSSSSAAASTTATSFTVVALEALRGKNVAVEQLTIGACALSPQLLRALSAAMPNLRWLHFTSYTLPVLADDDASAACALLAPFVNSFPQLEFLCLPAQQASQRRGLGAPAAAAASATSFDWLSFALLRAAHGEGGKEGSVARGVEPLAAARAPRHADAAAWKEAREWAATRNGNGDEWCQLPARLRVCVLDRYSSAASQPAYTRFSSPAASPLSPYARVERGLATPSYSSHAAEGSAERQFLAHCLSLHAVPAFFTAAAEDGNDAVEGGDDDVAADADDYGDDSSDDADFVEDAVNYPLPPPDEAFRSIVRRLRRSSPRLTTLSLPYFCQGQASANMNERFQLSGDTLVAVLRASHGNSALTSVRVHLQASANLTPLQLYTPLTIAVPTWTSLTRLDLAESVAAADAITLVNALCDAYEARRLASDAPSTTLEYLSISTAETVPESLIVACARLARVCTASLTSLTLCQGRGSNNNAATSLGQTWTRGAIDAFRSILSAGTRDEHANTPTLLFTFAGRFDDAREVAAEIVADLAVTRPCHLAFHPSEPHLRTDRNKNWLHVPTMATLLNAFIDTGGLLVLSNLLLSLGVGASGGGGKTVPLATRAAYAQLLQRLRARSPPFGVDDADMQLLWRSMLTDSTQNRGTPSLLPRPFFLDDDSLDDAALAFDRGVQLLLPCLRAQQAAQNPTLADLRAAAGPFVRGTDVWMHDDSLSARPVASVFDTPIDTLVSSTESSAAVDVAVPCVPIAAPQPCAAWSGRAAVRRSFRLNGATLTFFNEPDVWYGVPRSNALLPLLATSKMAASKEVQLAHAWNTYSRLDAPPGEGVINQLMQAGRAAYASQVGATVVCSLPAVSNDATQPPLAADALAVINDGGAAAVLAFVRGKTAGDEPLRVNIAAGALTLLAAYHTADCQARFVVHRAADASTNVDASVFVTDAAMATLFTLRMLVREDDDDDDDNDNGRKKKKKKKQKKAREGVPLAMTVIDGIGVGIYNNSLFRFDLASAETEAASATGDADVDAKITELFETFADAMLDGCKAQSMAWAGTDVCFVGNFSNKAVSIVVYSAAEASFTVSSTVSLANDSEMDKPVCMSMACSRTTLAVVTLGTVQVFALDAAGTAVISAPVWQRLRVIATSVGMLPLKVLPAGLFLTDDKGDGSGDVVCYQSMRQVSSGRPPLGVNTLVCASAQTGKVLTRIVSVPSGQNGTVSARARTLLVTSGAQLLELRIGDDAASADVGGDAGDEEAVNLFAVFEVAEVAQLPAHEQRIEVMRKKVRAFSRKKGARKAAVDATMAEASDDAERAELATCAFAYACLEGRTALAGEILDDCAAGTVPPFVWHLRVPSSGDEHFRKYVTQEIGGGKWPPEYVAPVNAFLSTALGVAISRAPVLGVRVLESQLATASPLALVAALVHGYSACGQYSSHLSNMQLGPPEEKAATCKLLKLLLAAVDDDAVCAVVPPDALHFFGMRLTHASSFKDEKARIVTLQSRPSAGEGDAEAAQAHVRHTALITQVKIAVQLVVQATTEEAFVAATAAVDGVQATVTSDDAPPVVATDAMRGVSTRTRAPRAGEGADIYTVGAVILRSQLRDFGPTLLGAACQESGQESESDVFLATRLALRVRLVKTLLHAGVDANALGINASGDPQPPIDEVCTPTLFRCLFDNVAALDLSRSRILFRLCGGDWAGTRSGKRGDDVDMYEARYALLATALQRGANVHAISQDHGGVTAVTFAEQQLAAAVAMLPWRRKQKIPQQLKLTEDGIKYLRFAIDAMKKAASAEC
jgi:hypothetical protein